MIGLVLIAVLVLAFANGANDNAKGVATLVGGRMLDLKPALRLAAVATFAGSACALLLAGGLIAKFSGKGLVDTEVLSSETFLACVGCAAAGAVLVATRFGIPISTIRLEPQEYPQLMNVKKPSDESSRIKYIETFIVDKCSHPEICGTVAGILYRNGKLVEALDFLEVIDVEEERYWDS